MPTWLVMILLSQVALVAGQIVLKHGMNLSNFRPMPAGRVGWRIGGGVALLTAWFLIWAGLLQKLPLSYVYPFEGISPVLLVLAARLILGERLNARGWLGVLAIAAGTLVVGAS